jgi:hypothetical protein
LQTGDALLDRISSVVVETHRACAEVIASPTSERGQWAGDVVSVGMDIAGVAFSDLRLCRRGLLQYAHCARPDGLVSGMYPGGDIYISMYAAQWVALSPVLEQRLLRRKRLARREPVQARRPHHNGPLDPSSLLTPAKMVIRWGFEFQKLVLSGGKPR